VFLYVCFFLHLSFQDLFIFAEYEFLTAVLVATELQGNYLFWGVTPSAKTAQLHLTSGLERRESMKTWPFCSKKRQVDLHFCQL